MMARNSGEVAMSRSRVLGFVAVLDENDEAAAVPRGFDERAGASDQSVGRVDRGAALTVEGRALNVDYEQSSGCHGIRVGVQADLSFGLGCSHAASGSDGRVIHIQQRRCGKPGFQHLSRRLAWTQKKRRRALARMRT